MAVLWHIHCKKFLKTDSVDRHPCSDNRYNADSSHLCGGLTACLLTTSEKAITPEEPPAPAVTFPTSHQRPGQAVWMERASGSVHPAHTEGDRHSPSGAAEVGSGGCSCQRHSSSPTPGKSKASEQCCSVSPAPHICLLFSFCLTLMFMAHSLLCRVSDSGLEYHRSRTFKLYWATAWGVQQDELWHLIWSVTIHWSGVHLSGTESAGDSQRRWQFKTPTATQRWSQWLKHQIHHITVTSWVVFILSFSSNC